MADSQLVEPVRLLYAAMLASVNDERGRSFLMKMADVQGDIVNLDALYCLGVFPFIAPRALWGKVEIDWAEETMVALMKDRNRMALKGAAHENVFGADGSCPSLKQCLLYVDSVGSGDDGFLRTEVGARCSTTSSRTKLSIPVVIGILFSAKTSSARRSADAGSGHKRHPWPGARILLEILRHSYRAAIGRFLGDLENDFVYGFTRSLIAGTAGRIAEAVCRTAELASCTSIPR